MKEKKRMWLNIGIGVFILLIFAFSIIYFSFIKQTFVQNTIAPAQFAGRFTSCDREEKFYCDNSAYDSTHPRPIADTTAVIGDYKVVTFVSSYQEAKACADKPIDSAVPTIVDSDGCQHWSYSFIDKNKGYCGYTCGSPYGSKVADLCSGGDCGCYNNRNCLAVYGIVNDVNADYGGKNKVVDFGLACWQKFQIYYKGDLIDETQWERSTQRVFDYDYIAMTLGQSSKYDGVTNECLRIMNSYAFKFPEQAFAFNVSTPKRQVVQGEDVVVDIKIINGWRNVKGNLSVEFEVPTTIGSAKRIDSKIVDVPYGESVVSYTVPTKQITDKLFVTPQLVLVLPTTEISGVNLPDENGVLRPPTYFTYYKYGTLTDEQHEVQINPAPLVIYQNCNENACPIGYACDKASGNCLSEQVVEKNLTCQIIGCPADNSYLGLHYSCSSSGLCVETVFSKQGAKNITCESPLTKVITDEFEYCVRSEYKEVLTQCVEAKDCQIPCSGLTVSCLKGSCNYEGSCTPIEIGCKELGCNDDYVCNKERNVCERTIGFNYVPYIIGVIVLFFVVIAILILRKKK